MMSHVLEHGGLELPNFDYDVGLLLSQPFYMPNAQEYTHIEPNGYVLI